MPNDAMISSLSEMLKYMVMVASYEKTLKQKEQKNESELHDKEEWECLP